MAKSYRTIKVYSDTYRVMKLIAAYQGQPLVQVLDEWADAQGEFYGFDLGDVKADFGVGGDESVGVEGGTLPDAISEIPMLPGGRHFGFPTALA